MDTLAVMHHTLDGLPYGVTVWRAESDHPDHLCLELGVKGRAELVR